MDELEATATVQDLRQLLQVYFRPDLSLSHVLHILSTLETSLPIIKLHRNQRRDSHQPENTAWNKHIFHILERSFRGVSVDDYFRSPPEADHIAGVAHLDAARLHRDLPQVVEFLGLNPDSGPLAIGHPPLVPKAHPLLITSHTQCLRCSPDVPRRSLRLDRDKGTTRVKLLDENLVWTYAELCVANCSSCHARYYPDKIVFNSRPADEEAEQCQRFEDNPTYLCISKSGVWAHRRVGLMQEHVMQCFAGGWSSFADWINAVSSTVVPESLWKMTARQSKRLFVERFSRRLLHVHTPHTPFSSPAYPPTDKLAELVRNVIGRDGGVIPSALTHGCKDCTHKKRYRQDLIDEGVELEAGHVAEVVGLPGGADLNENEVCDA